MDVREILTEICSTEGVNLVIGNEHTVAEMLIKTNVHPQFDEENLHLNSGLWTMHINLTKITSVELIKDKEISGFIPHLFYITFKDPKGGTIFSAFLPNPYLDDQYNKTDIQQDRLDLIEEMFNKYSKLEGYNLIDRSEDDQPES